ncbi:aldo/keto reductase [Winogradskyella undariae]|uniref:aldo/keto reductase n=1 Tax=Winogradskyella undariae TaxID=1285465 RepID=UPI00156AB2D2|nr:aldo/keto reductase [Winogradskyella undariae]NRR91223.1 aldo/keto reductase [Winogradskyella undariae]
MKTYFTLNNGIKIPSLGFGTWKTPDGETAIESIKKAVEIGYKHIDAAAIYANEEGVGAGIKACGIERKDLFITSKLWNAERGYESTLKAFEKTLEDLQLDYLDLYLIHWPAAAHQFENWQEINAETWRAMEKLHNEGKIKSLGVSNFMPHHLEPLMKTAKIQPSINQIEYHPGFTQPDCVKFCTDNNIQVEGWSPLGRGEVLDNEMLKNIAEKYNKSVAQVCIRWALQNNVIPLPKSVTPHRIEENFNVFDFEISEADMIAIDAMENIGASGLTPDTVEF